MEHPFGIDLSSYQASQDGTKRVDFDRMMRAAPPPSFIGMRSSLGLTINDSQFEYNWKRAGEKSLPRIAYHVVEFGADADRQAELLFARVYAADMTRQDRLCLDLEIGRNFDRRTITEVTLKAINRLVRLTGRMPIIYSRTTWMDEHLQVSLLPKLDYWLAQYRFPLAFPFFTGEYPSDKMTLPRGISKEQVKFHQSSDKGDGRKYGAVSYYLDYDRFLGTQEEILEWFGFLEQPKPEPEPEPEPKPEPEPEPEPPIVVEPDKPLYQVKVADWATPFVNVRSEPRIATLTDIGDVYPNETLQVFEEREVDQVLWLRSGKGWLMQKYTERVNEGGALAVKAQSQNDPRWKNVRLGTGTSTIGQEGCLVTCHSMIACYYGFETDPKQMNTWLTANNGYAAGNLYVWNSLNRRYPQLVISLWADCLRTPAPLNLLDRELDEKRPCIVWVDFNPNTAREEMHWVVITGKLEGGDYTIVDPWDGWTGSFKKRYGSPSRFIFRIVSYKRS